MIPAKNFHSSRGNKVVVVVVVVEVSIISVALSHCCCRTTVQWQ